MVLFRYVCVCLLYGNSSVSGLCVVLWGVVGGDDNTTQSSAPEDGQMVARNMLSNLYIRNKG